MPPSGPRLDPPACYYGASDLDEWRLKTRHFAQRSALWGSEQCSPTPQKTEIFGPQIGIESWTTEKNQILKTLAIGLLSRAWWIFLQRIAMGLHGQSYNLPPTNPRWRMAAILIIFVNRLYHRTGWWRYLHKTQPRGDGHVTKNGSGS